MDEIFGLLLLNDDKIDKLLKLLMRFTFSFS